jgi:hypothetical protein
VKTSNLASKTLSVEANNVAAIVVSVVGESVNTIKRSAEALLDASNEVIYK